MKCFPLFKSDSTRLGSGLGTRLSPSFDDVEIYRTYSVYVLILLTISKRKQIPHSCEIKSGGGLGTKLRWCQLENYFQTVYMKVKSVHYEVLSFGCLTENKANLVQGGIATPLSW